MDYKKDEKGYYILESTDEDEVILGDDFEDLDQDDLEKLDEQVEVEYWRVWREKMTLLYRLRQRNQRRANPSMPRLPPEAHVKDPHLLDCYLHIEQWKASNGENPNFIWASKLLKRQY